MEYKLLLQGSIEILISLVTGLLVFFISFKVFTMLTRDIDEIEELKKNNIAVGLFVAAFVFGIMLLVRSSIAPSVDAMTSAIIKSAGGAAIGKAALRVLIVYVIAAVFAFVIMWMSLKVFMILTTDIDEMAEIKNNNYSIAIVLTSLIASVALIMSKPLQTMLQSAVPMKFGTEKSSLIDTNLLMAGAIQTAIAFFAVVFILFVSFKAFDFLTKSIEESEELKKNNLAVAILLASFLFAMMMIIEGPIGSANGALLGAIQAKAGIGIAFGKVVLYFIMAAVIAFIILAIAVKAFTILTTTIDEMEEIKNNKAAVSVVLAVLIISMALLVANGLPALLEGAVPLSRVLAPK